MSEVRRSEEDGTNPFSVSKHTNNMQNQMALSLQHNAALMSVSNKRQAEVMTLPPSPAESLCFSSLSVSLFYCHHGNSPWQDHHGYEIHSKIPIYSLSSYLPRWCAYLLLGSQQIIPLQYAPSRCVYVCAFVFQGALSSYYIRICISGNLPCLQSLFCSAVVCTSLQVSCCECAMSRNSFQSNSFFRGNFSAVSLFIYFSFIF